MKMLPFCSGGKSLNNLNDLKYHKNEKEFKKIVISRI